MLFYYKDIMDNYKVYKHTFPNNKIYIGITKQDVRKRWQNGLGYYSQLYMRNAIKKYGWGNIKHEVLFEHLTKEEAEQKEKENILLYRSSIKKYGYNIEKGGSINKIVSHSTRQKLSKCRKGKTYVMPQQTKDKLRAAHLGKHLSEETKNKLSIAHKGKHLSDAHKLKLKLVNTGRTHTEETKRILSIKNTGKPSKLKGIKRPQYIIDILREVNKNKILSQETREKIRQKHLGMKMTKLNMDKILNAVRRPVEMYSKENVLLATYIDIKTAGEKNNIHRGSISDACRNKRKTAGGYIWRYKITE